MTDQTVQVAGIGKELQDQEKTTVSTKQVIVFHLDNEEYAVAIEEVKEVVKLFNITPVPNSPNFILGVINLRGKILPILDLEKRFKLQKENNVIHENIMIFEDKKNNLFGICVDKVVEVLRVPIDIIKPTPEILESKISAEFLKGVIVIQDQKETNNQDRLLLFLDLQKILETSAVDKLQPTGEDKSEVMKSDQVQTVTV